MTTRRVLFRVDASSSLGLGHVMRCLVLARALLRRDIDSVFLCRDLPGHAMARIEAEGFSVLPLTMADDGQGADAEACLEALAALQWERPADWLIVDHYGLDRAWEKRMRGMVARLMVIDDVPHRRHDCDILLNANLSALEDVERNDCQDYLRGPRYALLSEGFARVGDKREIGQQARRLLLSFGGADAAGDTEKALRALAGLSGWRIDVVIGAANARRRQIEQLAAGMPGVRCHYDVSDMTELMARADLALGAGGVSALERCAAGLPGIVISQADNQRAPARSLAEAGVLLYLGDSAEVTEAAIERAVVLLAENVILRQVFSRRGRELVDGRGIARVMARLFPPDIELRQASMDDCGMIWQWRNSEPVRRYSGDGEPIAWQTHQHWLQRTLLDPERHLLVAECRGAAVGVLRYDIDTEAASAEVSLYLDPDRHGQGLGTALLRAGHDWLRRHRPEVTWITAVVRNANTASQALFAKLGYRPWQQTWRYSLREQP